MPLIKSANRRIIVSAIQIVESGFAIEIITSVTKRIIGSSRRSAAVGIGNGSITPSIIGAVIIIPYFLDIIKVIVYISYRKIILDGYFT